MDINQNPTSTVPTPPVVSAKKDNFFKTKGGMIATAIILILLILLSALGFYTYRNTKNSNDTANTSTPTPTPTITATDTPSPTATSTSTVTATLTTTPTSSTSRVEKFTVKGTFSGKDQEIQVNLNNNLTLKKIPETTNTNSYWEISDGKTFKLEFHSAYEGYPVNFKSLAVVGATTYTPTLARGLISDGSNKWIYTETYSNTASCGSLVYTDNQTVPPCGNIILSKVLSVTNSVKDFEYFLQVMLIPLTNEGLTNADNVMKSVTSIKTIK